MEQFAAFAIGATTALVAAWVGYRFGYQAKTGDVPMHTLTEPEYGGAILDAAPVEGEALDE